MMTHEQPRSSVIEESELPRISVIDDDESVREAIKSLMDSVGYRADVFSSAEDFLNSDQFYDTACLILDVRMPGMSGLELQNYLNTTNSRIPIVFISAHDDDNARSGAFDAGAIDFLKKPFTEDELLRAISTSLHFH